MELIAQRPLSHTHHHLCSVSVSPLFICLSQNSLPANSQYSFMSFAARDLKSVCIKARRCANVGAIYASEGQSVSVDGSERWLLEPVGDGDTKHIGFKTAMPDAFEIASNEVTVGRLPQKADMVIPVATVSGLHARIRKKGGNLLVTDLDSTNGTFVDDQRLRPGVVATVSNGSCITFGDTHLAIFRASKLENVETSTTTDETVEQPNADGDQSIDETN